MYYGLSDIKELKRGRALDIVKREYDLWQVEFLPLENRPKLQGDLIIIDKKIIGGMHERYLHAISLEDKGYGEKIVPCTNDISKLSCLNGCKIECAELLFQSLKPKRMECMYRLSRIHWVKEIIELANKNDSNVKVWRYEKQDKTNSKWHWNKYVRYESGLVDFLIVFTEEYEKDGTLKGLNFRTAYPVFLPGDAKKLDKEYSKAKKIEKRSK